MSGETDCMECSETFIPEPGESDEVCPRCLALRTAAREFYQKNEEARKAEGMRKWNKVAVRINKQINRK